MGMIKVCDAIMGSGKSSAAIQYMNDNPDNKFLYLAPYIAEDERVRDACPELHIELPRTYASSAGNSKTNHTYELLSRRCNVASTHQAISYYTSEMLKVLKDNHYTVIIDEVVNILEPVNKDKPSIYNIPVSSEDVEMLLAAGYIKETVPGEYHLGDKKYTSYAFRPLLKKMESTPLIRLADNDEMAGYKRWRWLFPKEIFEYADKVIILTYLFEGSEMQQFFKICGFDYDYIGVSHPEPSIYRFTDGHGDIPEYVNRLSEKIHLCVAGKMNSLGDDWYAMSENWYLKEENACKVELQKERAVNFYKNYSGGAKANERMYAAYKNLGDSIKDKSFGRKAHMVMFNQKAKNDWRDCTALYYPINIFLNPSISRFYESKGGCVDPEKYALSTLIQWIWRSAIRDGGEIYLYLPSRRMRTLFVDWIYDVSGVRMAG